MRVETRRGDEVSGAAPAEDARVTTICLVRHGETDWNRASRLQGREDIPLNERGREQAELAARFLAREPWDLVISSPLCRAHETAQIIARAVGIQPVLVLDAFIERDYGVASGLTIAERDARYPSGVWPGYESWDDLGRRCCSGLDDVAQRYGGRRIVLVSHGAAINALLGVLSDGVIGNGKTALRNACLCWLRKAGGQWQILNYNCVDHLTEPHQDADLA